MWEKGSLLKNKKRILQQKIGGRHVASQEPYIFSRFYPDFILILSKSIQTLSRMIISRFYYNFILICLETQFILILSLFYLEKSG